MSKLIKLTDDHYVVVTDEPIEWKDYFLNIIQKKVYCHDIENYDVNKHYLKKITHSTQPLGVKPITDKVVIQEDKAGKPLMSAQYVELDMSSTVKPLPLQEVKELIGEVDVEKMATDYSKTNSKIESTGAEEFGRYWGFKEGYNQALEDNKEKKYTEEDMINAFREGTNAGALHERLCDYDNGDYEDAEQYSEQYEESFIKSLQPKTQWEVEWETIDNREPCNCSCHNNPNMIHFVACCNDGWIGTVTQKLKLK